MEIVRLDQTGIWANKQQSSGKAMALIDTSQLMLPAKQECRSVIINWGDCATKVQQGRVICLSLILLYHIVQVNVCSPVSLTHHFLKDMGCRIWKVTTLVVRSSRPMATEPMLHVLWSFEFPFPPLVLVFHGLLQNQNSSQRNRVVWCSLVCQRGCSKPEFTEDERNGLRSKSLIQK